MKPAAKRKAARRAPAKRAKSAKSARRASPKHSKTASRAPVKRAKTASRAPVKAAKAAKAVEAPVKQLKTPLAPIKRAQPRGKSITIPVLASPEIAVSAHKFRIGENVHLTAGVFARGGAGSVYKVTQLLPSDGDEQQYRIKSATEPHERVAKQSQLERAA
jgi:hypothetical protein